jgi:hypothetical protein
MKKIDLAELKKRLQARAVLAISFETAEISVALLRREGDLTRAGESFTIAIGAEEAISDPERAGTALADALDRARVRERRCAVCIPRRWAMTSTTQVPDLSGEDLRSFVELRAETEFTIGSGDLRLAHSAYRLPDGQQHVMIAGVPAKRMDALQRVLETAGCRAVSVSLGLDRPARLGESGASLQFLANCDYVDVVVAAGGGVTSLRTLPGPKGSSFDALSFLREVRITLGRLPAQVRQGITSARFAGPTETVQTLLAETAEPLRKLGIAHTEVEPGGASAHPALDAAERYLRRQPVLFELVRREEKPWQTALARFDDKKRRWVLIGIVGLVILPILTLIIRSRMESNLAREWQAMRGEVADLEKLQQQIRQFRPWFDSVPQALQCLEAVAACFPESGEVWAKSAQLGENGKVTCVGFAKTQAAILALLDRLRAKPGVTALQLQGAKGDNPIQFTIIFQWEAKNAP